MLERWASSNWKLPALSGAILAVAYYSPLFLSNSIAFLPLLFWLDARPAGSPPRAFRTGLVFGLTTHLITMHFCYATLRFTWLGSLMYLGTALALALKIALFFMILSWLRRRTRLGYPLLLLASWLPLEGLATFGDLRMTADHLAHSLTGLPFLIQFADLVGPYGVGAVMLLVNGLLYELFFDRIRSRRRRAAIGLAFMLLAVLAYDAWAWNREAPAGERARIALIQPNIPIQVKFDSNTTYAEQWKVLVELSQEAAELDPDLIVWPESAVPWPLVHRLDQPETFDLPIVRDLARELGTALLVGVEYYRVEAPGDFDLYNAAMAIDAQGTLLPEWGAKVYLVPFVEATPFRKLFGPLVAGRGGEWRWLAGVFQPGPPNVVVDVAGARIGTLVCYEQLFPDLSRDLRNAGAQIQMVITNDAWWGRSAFQRFQANALRLRAIENRTEFVRVANTGISGFVDRRGRYHHETPLFEEGVAIRDVTLATAPTLYDRTGDLVLWLSMLALAASALLAALRPR